VNLSSPNHENEQRNRLADLIATRAGEIEQRWLDRIKAALGDRELSPTELRNSMSEYLVRLVEGLRQAETVEAGGTSSWDNVARQHAEARVRLGFDIDQLVHEFIVLRQVLFSMLKEEGALLDFRQAGRLADLIEGAIAAAVRSYVTSRDYEARKREAEHVGFITHELRNPLTTAVLGTQQLLRKPGNPSEQRQTLAVVDRNLLRLSELIEGVLLVERDAHALKPQLAVLTLGQLLDQPLSAAKLAAESKGLHLETRFDPNVVVQVDSKLSVSAIDNVIQNAIKFTDIGQVEIVAEDNPNEVVLHVRDSGQGISKEDMRTIFEPFRRGQSGKPGAGLGLAIARRAVEAQGGTIHAESPGGTTGSHFWLTFPKPRH
jgi:signal transduction histidine kinase